jgi:predicted glycoside hydrolase/deacetylase ChbG (UPF0249 family)
VNLIINGDDFGLSSSVNEGIVRAFQLGIIDRATAIANAPFFAHACELARAHGFEDRIGVHFNITEGKPISSRIAHTPVFCSDGKGFSFRRNTTVWLSRSEVLAVSDECEGQILRFKEQRLRPTQFDSHRHVHTEWSIFRAIEPVLKRLGISSVRMAQNIGTSSFPKTAYKRIFNSYLKKRKWTSTDYFGDYSEILKCSSSLIPAESVVEAMVHPTIDCRGALIDAISGQELAPQIDALRKIN